ncbi:MAG: Rrf2 family transcriptional regulator [Gammaproteobacteria bacterium]|nr:Rrf2 family transcriptional regulator [Gammaproteobacteria bacterium]MCG3142818.1 HTH-type transcriptional regulator IscR [Gammaproteobacteria bacterium]
MRLTTRGRYAVTAMLDLALHNDSGPIALSDIAQRQDISLTYLEQLFARLRRRNLVSSARGPRGGYRLSKPLDQISVADVIAAVDESVDATRCGGAKNCHGKERCLTHDLWEELSHEIVSFLGRISLGMLAARGMRRESNRMESAAHNGTYSVPVWRIHGKRG